MVFTLSIFALDARGHERTLRRATIAEEVLGAYLTAPDAALRALPPEDELQPDGFRITDPRGRIRIAHTGARRMRWTDRAEGDVTDPHL